MTQEDPMIKGISRENPFRVPEGYFDAFPQRLAERIRRRKRRVLRLWQTAVAASLVLGFGAWGLWQYNYAQKAAEQMAEYSYVEDELDYGMFNNTDIALYLTEAE